MPFVVCDNCKQAVIANKDWIQPELNQDYAEWTEHNHTVILPAKVRKPKFKSSVENAVGILKKGFFHDLEEHRYFTLEQFNEDLWEKLEVLNDAPFKEEEHCRSYYWAEEKEELMPLPSTQYHYMERSTEKVSSDLYLHKKVIIWATATVVRIFSQEGELIVEWPRAHYKGEWKTNSDHLPKNYEDFSEWNSTYFIRKASTVGSNTTELIKRILKSRPLEVQTYRLCMGVLGYTKKYSRAALKECSRRALAAERTTYTYIKNTIGAVAEELGDEGYNTDKNRKRNEGSYIMDSSYSDMEKMHRSGEFFKECTIVIYEYQKGRNHKLPLAFYQDYNGVLVTDGLKQYHLLHDKSPSLTNANCWAHARRDYADAIKAANKADGEAVKCSIVYQALRRIALIYELEGTLKPDSGRTSSGTTELGQAVG